MPNPNENQFEEPRHREDPPGSSALARAVARRAMAPIEAFLAVQASSGVLLVCVAVLAIAWANSPFAHWYTALWHTQVGLRVGPFAIERDLHFWINDGAMAVFFFVVGLEIRRELHAGELSDWRRAALPLAAALGGMIVPASVYAAFNYGGASPHGWGVPMATDIAFAVGILALLGNRVPPAARVLLLALAVIDDVGGIAVIALFYSSGVVWSGVLVAAAGVVSILLLQAFGVRRPWMYFAPAAIVWTGMLRSGVHPTLAGVVVGMLTPVRSWLDRPAFSQRVRAHLEHIEEAPPRGAPAILDQLDSINEARREAVSPVDRLQHAFHGTVAFLVMPLFALSNAGVKLSAASLGVEQRPVVLGVTLGLLVGKPLGITLAAWLAVRAKIAELPKGLRWSHVALVGLLGGIGFTVSLFIAALAFAPGAALDAAKTAVLIASVAAGLLSLIGGRALLRPALDPGAAQSESEAEQATEQ